MIRIANLNLLFLVILILSCNEKPNTKFSDTDSNKYGKGSIVNLTNDEPKDYLVSDLFKTADFIPLETSEQSRLTEIDEVLFFNGIYIIFDIRQKCLFGFDENGKFKFKIFPSGKGPLELNDITDYTINKKNNLIDIYDFSQRKIISFDMDGYAKKEKKINYFFREFSCTSSGDYVLYSPDMENESIKSGAFIVDSSGKFKHSFLKTSPQGQYIQPVNCLSGFGDSIILVSNYTKDIFIINNENIKKKFAINCANDWTQSLILSNGSGGLLNFVYRKELDNPKSFSVFLNVASDKELHFNYILNDLFTLPFAIPHLFKDSKTLLAFINPEQKKDFQKVLNQDKLPPAANKQLISQIKDVLSKMETSDNYLMIKLAMK